MNAIVANGTQISRFASASQLRAGHSHSAADVTVSERAANLKSVIGGRINEAKRKGQRQVAARLQQHMNRVGAVGRRAAAVGG